MIDVIKLLTDEELINEFSRAAIDLAGSGARGRARYSEAKEELLRRLEGVKK